LYSEQEQEDDRTSSRQIVQQHLCSIQIKSNHAQASA
jgi:hypothetical protein